jgi:hypothetical protein
MALVVLYLTGETHFPLLGSGFSNMTVTAKRGTALVSH